MVSSPEVPNSAKPEQPAKARAEKGIHGYGDMRRTIDAVPPIAMARHSKLPKNAAWGMLSPSFAPAEKSAIQRKFV